VAAGDAGVAEAAEPAVVAADADAAEVVACRGALAASAEPEHFPITLTNTDHHGRARHNRSRPIFVSRPSHVVLAVQRTSVGARTTDERIQYFREMPARELDEGIPVVGEYALHRRAGALGKVRVKS
jgi:hypothetical protein